MLVIGFILLTLTLFLGLFWVLCEVVTRSTAWLPLARHGSALLGSTLFFGSAPTILYVGGIIWADDLGGPLNLIIIPLVSTVIGFAVSVVAFLPLGLLAERFQLRRWLWVVGGLCSVLAVLVLLAWIAVARPGHWVFPIVCSLSLYVIGGFFAYLCCLAVSRRMVPKDATPG